MFAFDFKPQFYSYPLDYREWSRILVRAREVQTQISQMGVEVEQIRGDSNRDKYGQYLKRLQEKIQVLRQQAHEYSQILAINKDIHQQLKSNKKNSAQVKNKLLDHYKAAIQLHQYQKPTHHQNEPFHFNPQSNQDREKEGNVRSKSIKLPKISHNSTKYCNYSEMKLPFKQSLNHYNNSRLY